MSPIMQLPRGGYVFTFICLDRCTFREPAGLPCHIAATSVRVISDVLGIGKGTRCLVFLHGPAAIFDTVDSDLSIGLS